MENDPGWVAKHCRPSRNILDNYRSSTYCGTFANLESGQDGRVRMDHNLSANSCPTTDKHHGTNLGVVADIGIMPDDGHGVNVCEIANPYIGTDRSSIISNDS